MAKSFKRSLQDNLEGYISAPKRACIVKFNDYKDEEKFIYLYEIRRPEERIDKIHEIKIRKLVEPPASVHRMDRVCQLVSNNMKSEHGHDCECYQRFTMNLVRLKASQVVEEESGPSRRSSTSSSNGIIFSPDCIFCNKTGLMKVKGSVDFRECTHIHRFGLIFL